MRIATILHFMLVTLHEATHCAWHFSLNSLPGTPLDPTCRGADKDCELEHNKQPYHLSGLGTMSSKPKPRALAGAMARKVLGMLQ